MSKEVFYSLVGMFFGIIGGFFSVFLPFGLWLCLMACFLPMCIMFIRHLKNLPKKKNGENVLWRI